MTILCVAGCSFSDFTKVDNVYGQHMANKLGYEYLHEGAGCGSNYRIWRRIVGHILSGRLTREDLLVVQITDISRREFWSDAQPPDHSNLAVNDIRVNEAYGNNNGSIIRYKLDASVWQSNDENTLFFESFQKHHLNPEYELEQFIVYHAMFQHFLIAHDIKTIFTKPPNTGELNLLPPFATLQFKPPNTLMDNAAYCNTPTDNFHMSDRGHIIFADMLYDHIINVGNVI